MDEITPRFTVQPSPFVTGAFRVVDGEFEGPGSIFRAPVICMLNSERAANLVAKVANCGDSLMRCTGSQFVRSEEGDVRVTVYRTHAIYGR